MTPPSAGRGYSAIPGLFGNSVYEGGSATGQKDKRTILHGVFMIFDNFPSNYIQEAEQPTSDRQSEIFCAFIYGPDLPQKQQEGLLLLG
jgi:hypothetical protein